MTESNNGDNMYKHENKLPVILFEGLDGAGKTYALNHLKEHYEKKRIPVHVVDSIPFGTFLNSHDKEWFDLNIKNVRYVEYLAWQVNNYYKNIKPFIGREVILIDRFVPSCFAYNSFEQDEFGLFFEAMMERFLDSFYIPDVTFLVDVSNEVLLERHKRTDQPVQMSKLTFINEVRRNYSLFFQIHARYGAWKNVEALDGTKDINELVKEMDGIINDRFKVIKI